MSNRNKSYPWVWWIVVGIPVFWGIAIWVVMS